MKKLSTLVFPLALFVLFACMIQPADKIEKVSWLIGTWENKTSKGSIYETWKRKNKNELTGKSYVLKDQDTITFETISLAQVNNNLFYIPAVKNQNDGLPIRFELKSIADTVFIFENSTHDFPQVISYALIEQDSLLAEISGNIDGQIRRQRFPMKRIK